MQENIINSVADKILGILSLDHPLRVGINGVDGSGKTYFGENLSRALRAKTKRQIISVSIDGFHHPRSFRYQKGRESGEGFYRDSFQYQVIHDLLLKPLGANGDRKYRTKVFNVHTDQAVEEDAQIADDNSILIFEGIFLFRPELASELDYKIYIDVPFEVTLHRMLKRDRDLFEVEAEEVRLFHTRYKAGQEMYLNEVHPKEISDLIIDNTDFEKPIVLKGL